MLSAKKELFTSAGGAYQISRSVRLRKSATAYLNRTFGTPTSLTTWTWSGWVKRGELGTSQYLFHTRNAGNTVSWETFFQTDNTLIVRNYDGASYNANYVTTQLFRDPSAWYHMVVTWDTTNATSTDRVRIYINGSRVTAFNTSTAPASSANSVWNTSTYVHGFGAANGATTFDGYLTETNFVDGQALTPSSFGETNSVTGVWQPKKYAGTYGTNGFYLNFSDNSGATATTIGKDYSGNGNNWTPNNISITAGATYDSMLDVPTPYADGGNGRGNYAVFNPLSRTACTITNGNLQAVGDGGNYDNLPASIAFDAGGSDGFYWEFTSIINNSSTVVGICSINNSELNKANPTFSFANSVDGWGYLGNGDKVNSGTTSAYGNSWTNNDVIGVAVKNGKIWFSKNGIFQASGDPAAGTNQAFSSISGLVYPVAGINGTNGFNINFGQRPFSYTPPTGFVALNTQNLPTPTISNGANYMAATTYTGTGSALTIANTVGSASFQPDFVWTKPRSTAVGHTLFDSLRGVTKYLQSNTTGAEGTAATSLTAFNSDGFTVNSDTSTGANGVTYIGWQWNAGGSTVTNTSGTISSQVRANPTAGFSVVTYTGTGTAATIGHGLGVAPSMMIIKSRPTASTSWIVYHSSISPTNLLTLQTTAAQQNLPLYFNSTAPTSSVFSIGSAANTGTDLNVNGSTYVAYCFAAVAGYSAFGSYTGNGSADGVFVYLGFRARFLMIKRTDSASGWVMLDTARDTYNDVDNYLYANSSAANAGSSNVLDINSNGFKIRNSWTDINASGGTYVYMAFCENPFKFSNAR
jgi:hypothetical protein